jgi:hypothetical protein
MNKSGAAKPELADRLLIATVGLARKIGLPVIPKTTLAAPAETAPTAINKKISARPGEEAICHLKQNPPLHEEESNGFKPTSQV